MPALLALAVLLLALPDAAHAQGEPTTDTLLTWRTYGDERAARIRVFPTADEDRPRAVVVDERAETGGAPVTDEARFFAETVGRTLGFDPAGATFVFRYTAAAFTPGADDRGKVLFLRATFRRDGSGDLGSPSWRVITREALDELTDRAFR